MTFSVEHNLERDLETTKLSLRTALSCLLGQVGHGKPGKSQVSVFAGNGQAYIQVYAVHETDFVTRTNSTPPVFSPVQS